jgi:phosphohistidine phosphatase SixA
MPHVFSFLALAAGLSTATVDSTELRREDLMSALQRGGYTVILRHARTDRSFREEIGTIPKERSAQRNLTDEGVKDAALMGVVFRRYGIAFAEIISSPMYRCTETAEYSVGKPTSIAIELRTFPPTPEQAALVFKAPKPGTNRLLVTHHFVLETHVPGIKPGDIAESEAAVVRHTTTGKVELVGRITLDDWSRLANPAPSKSAPDEKRETDRAHGPLSALARLIHGDPDKDKAAAEIPDTHAGHLAREYIAAFNSGSADRMRTYLDSYMDTDPARPTTERLKSYAKLFEDHGSLSVVNVETSGSTEVVLGMRSRQGNFRLTVKSSEAQPMRAASVTFTMLQQRGHP